MASNVTLTVVFAVMLLIVYLLLDTIEVTSVLPTFTLAIRQPVSGVNVIVAEVPSFTENEVVLPLTVVPLYEAEPLPEAVIFKV